MQSRPLRQKKDKSINIVTIALIISWLIIFAGVRWVFYGQKSVQQPTNLIEETGNENDTSIHDAGEVLQEKTYYMGEKILAAGVLTPTESFTTYTHNFVSEQGDTFGLKSKDLDLYTYEGTVQLKGSINDFNKDLPIILVTEIVAETGGAGDADEEVDTNKDFYLFKDEKIGFDLSISEGFVVEQEGDEIHLKDATQDNATKLKISPFTCTVGDALRDCVSLKENFISIGSDSFVSSQGVKFYNLTETITWIAFDPTGTHGYYLTPTNEQEFVSFANLMSFVNEDILKTALDEEVSNLCKNINYTMREPDEINYDYTTAGAVRASLNETTSTDIELQCELSLRLGNTIKVTPVSFNTDGDTVAEEEINEAEEDEDTFGELAIEDNQDEEETDTDDTPKNEEVTKPIAAPDISASQVPENWSGAGWFKYNSVRGYDVYFSNKSISYAGEILTTPQEIVPGVACTYKINVIQWQRADDVNTNPDMAIYECIGSEINNDIFQTVGTAGGKIFIAEWYTNNLGDTSVIVE